MTSPRGEIAYATQTTKKEHVTSGMYCGSCGVTIGPDNLHGRDCIDVRPERRRP